MRRRRWTLREPGALAFDITLVVLAIGFPIAALVYRARALELAGDALGAAADLLFGLDGRSHAAVL